MSAPDAPRCCAPVEAPTVSYVDTPCPLGEAAVCGELATTTREVESETTAGRVALPLCVVTRHETRRLRRALVDCLAPIPAWIGPHHETVEDSLVLGVRLAGGWTRPMFGLETLYWTPGGYVVARAIWPYDVRLSGEPGQARIVQRRISTRLARRRFRQSYATPGTAAEQLDDALRRAAGESTRGAS